MKTMVITGSAIQGDHGMTMWLKFNVHLEMRHAFKCICKKICLISLLIWFPSVDVNKVVTSLKCANQRLGMKSLDPWKPHCLNNTISSPKTHSIETLRILWEMHSTLFITWLLNRCMLSVGALGAHHAQNGKHACQNIKNMYWVSLHGYHCMGIVAWVSMHLKCGLSVQWIAIGPSSKYLDRTFLTYRWFVMLERFQLFITKVSNIIVHLEGLTCTILIGWNKERCCRSRDNWNSLHN